MADRKQFWPEPGMRRGPTSKDPLNQHGERGKVVSSLREGTQINNVMRYIGSTDLTPGQKIELGRYAIALSDFIQENDGLPQIKKGRDEDGIDLKKMGGRILPGGPRRLRSSRRATHFLHRSS